MRGLEVLWAVLCRSRTQTPCSPKNSAALTLATSPGRAPLSWRANSTLRRASVAPAMSRAWSSTEMRASRPRLRWEGFLMPAMGLRVRTPLFNAPPEHGNEPGLTGILRALSSGRVLADPRLYVGLFHGVCVLRAERTGERAKEHPGDTEGVRRKPTLARHQVGVRQGVHGQ